MGLLPRDLQPIIYMSLKSISTCGRSYSTRIVLTKSLGALSSRQVMPDPRSRLLGSEEMADMWVKESVHTQWPTPGSSGLPTDYILGRLRNPGPSLSVRSGVRTSPCQPCDLEGSHLTFPNFGFFIYKMGMIRVATS